MKASMLCITVLCIANVNGALRPLDSFDDAASDRSGLSRSESWSDVWWKEATIVYKFSRSYPQKARSKFDRFVEEPFLKLWYRCNQNFDDEVTHGELTTCARDLTFLGFMQGQNWFYQFVEKYWTLIDEDSSGGLKYEKFHDMFAFFALVDARVIFQAYKIDDDGYLAGKELRLWWDHVITWTSQFQLNDDQLIAIRQVWGMAETSKKMTTDDIANAEIKTWGIFFQTI